MWLLGRLVLDDKLIGDFRKDNGPAIRKAPLEAGAGPLSERRHARDWGRLADLE
jgi:hypothetical protein